MNNAQEPEFDLEVLAELTFEGPGGGIDDYLVVDDYIVGVGRWSTNYALIFKYQERYFRLIYRRAATEQQEGGDYKISQHDIEEVFPAQIQMTKYLTQKEIDKHEHKS